MTFRNKADAFAAIEQGNDDTSYPKVDLCFGGRRTFCKEKYSDLGKYKFYNIKRLGVSNNVDPRINLQIIMYPIFFSDSRSLHTSRRGTALADDNDDVEQQSEKTSTKNDFDTLLKRARAGIRNNK